MKEKNIDHLFEVARKGETEFTKERITTLVNEFPELENSKSVNPKQSLFSLKNLLMLSLIVFIGSFLIIESNKVSSSTEQVSQLEEIELIGQLPIEAIEHEIHLTGYSINQQNIASANIKETFDKAELTKERHKIQESKVKDLDKEEKRLNEKLIEVPNDVRQTSTGSINVFPTNNDKIEMTSRELLNLKRTLIKNLINDNLIESKLAAIEMQLKERSIIMNGQELDGSSYSKYRNLTTKAGWGENRKIIINERYIRVGDFDGLNFIGIGVGRFFAQDELSDKNLEQDKNQKEKDLPVIEQEKSEREKREEIIEQENKALNKIVEEIYGDSSGPFRKSFFNGNRYKQKDMRELHAGIYKQLVDSYLDINTQSLIVLELKENQLLLNGEKLDSELETNLSKFLSKYKLKRKDFRMIKLTEHSVAIGDYRPGSFTGTHHYIY